MPIIQHVPLSLKTSQVVRREGLKDYSKVRPEIRSLIQELLATLNKASVLEPAIAYEIYTITQLNQRQLSLEGKAVIRDSSLPSLLPQARELAVAVCTIGPKLEKRVTDYTSRGEPLRGLLLDGIGSAAVDSLMEETCKLVASEASSRGYESSSPVSPGMPGLPITEQSRLLKLVPAQEIGVSLTSGGMMVPRKSVSLVIGIGSQMTKWTRAEICARCHLKKRCAYRIPVSN